MCEEKLDFAIKVGDNTVEEVKNMVLVRGRSSSLVFTKELACWTNFKFSTGVSPLATGS